MTQTFFPKGTIHAVITRMTARDWYFLYIKYHENRAAPEMQMPFQIKHLYLLL
jgi:hypothetical protein